MEVLFEEHSTIMKKLLIPSLFALGFIAAAPGISFAQSVQFVPPMTTESGATVEIEDDALNYFATDAEERKAMEEKKAAAPEGHVPASELEYLPEELELGGKAKLKVEGGRITSDTEAGAQSYDYCEDYQARGETVPDGCIQKGGAELPASAANTAMPAPAPISSQQPQTLDAQLEAKGDAAPEPVAVDANVTSQTQIDSGAHIENTAVVDKARGAKTNIISNTDTGVKLDY